MLEVTPHLDKNLKEPLYIQLFFHIKTEIRNGNIKTGEKLPSKRRLAQHLGISQNTVDNAYQQLYAEGYINSEPRRGMFVIYKEPNLFTYQSLRKSIEYTEPKFTKGINNNLSIDFNPGNIDVSHFPYKKWRVYSNESMSQEQSKLFSHGHPKGDILLREQIASYLYQARGVRASID